MNSDPPRLKDWNDDERVHQVHSFFDAITPKYDLINRLISLGMDSGWRRRAIAKLQDSTILLDIATGTGDMVAEMHRQQPNCQAVGLDIVQAMVKQASRKLDTKKVQNAAFIHGDALALPFEDDVFDAVTIAFGLRNIPDKQAALSEIHRVLQPGGRLVMLELSLNEKSFIGGVNRWYMRHVVPALGRLMSGSNIAYQYLTDSMEKMDSRSTILQLLEKQAFRQSSVTRLFPGVVLIVDARK
ncbi:bifunctional demethylmenaquinone methyltransferase/2-methoxy-6-polyprenyl-1,4-benzoquinol methylase UbiE [Calditrichota bacterium]